MNRNLNRRCVVTCGLVVLLCLGASGWLVAQEGASSNPVDSAAADESEKQERLREGSVVKNLAGVFRMTGDRVTFVPEQEGDESYLALENLALERVARVLSESRQQREWSVSGTLTEFRGSNYILVTRAVLKARPRSSR